MSKHSIRKVISRRFRETDKHFREMKRTSSFDSIHDFRVEIKKLRAFLRLLSSPGIQQVKIPAGLKKIYRSSGIIREFQVLLERNKKQQLFSVFRQTKFRHSIKEERSELKKITEGYSLHADETAIAKQLPAKITYSQIRHFFSDRLNEVEKLLASARINNEMMHLVRKLLKDLLYCAQILEREMGLDLPSSVWNRNKEKYFTLLTTGLGEYHDRCVEQQVLKNYNGIKKEGSLRKMKKELIASMVKNVSSQYPEMKIESTTKTDSGNKIHSPLLL